MQEIILLHGALGSKMQMAAFEKVLSQYFKVFILEFSGHGSLAYKGDPFTIENMALQYNDFLNQNNLVNASSFGYSMGGYVALYHAILFPGKQNKIITLATKFDWNPISSEKEAKHLNPFEISCQNPSFSQLLFERHGQYWEQVVLRTAEMMIAMGKNPTLNSDNMTLISSDVLICIGDKDKMVSMDESQKYADYIKNSSVKILSDTPHPFERVDLKKLLKLVLDFIYI